MSHLLIIFITYNACIIFKFYGKGIMNILQLVTLKNKRTLVSISTILAIYSTQISASEIPTITVEGTEISDVSGEEIKSADVAEALTKKIPSVSLIRRSGIANDIIVRGQNKDNINIVIDSAKIYGACPNRMDPPTSHILTNNIESIDIVEGPYDVENFGTLSASVKIKTKKPEKDFHGEISANAGRWNYKKMAATFSGGNDKVRALVSLSKESSAQYRDGDGNNFDQQIRKSIASTMVRYKDQYNDMDAYDKKTFMGKMYLNLIDNHELAVSYTANRSDDILYPSSKMDALYDDSNILNIDYSIKNLAKFSKKLDFQYYDSDVEHPMSTKYRNSSGPNSANEKVSKLTTRMQGFKLKNAFDLSDTLEATIGLDSSLRNWDGQYTGYGMSSWITGRPSISDVDTQNNAIFVEMEKRYIGFSLKTGMRYDDTSIKPSGGQQSNDYRSFSAFAHGTYQFSGNTRFFGGFGKSSRVPDARELYFTMAGMNPMMPGMVALHYHYQIYPMNQQQLLQALQCLYSYSHNLTQGSFLVELCSLDRYPFDLPMPDLFYRVDKPDQNQDIDHQ